MAELERERCSGCGHGIPAFCVICCREILCGTVAEPCPEEGCLEGRHPDTDPDGYRERRFQHYAENYPEAIEAPRRAA